MGISFKRRGPKYGALDQERVRAKLADANIADRLLKAFMGEIEMTQSQVAIGMKMLDKLVPNLQSVEQKVENNAPFAVLPAVVEDVKAWEQTFDPHQPDPKAKH
jgi:hypothetical protein